MTRALVCGSRGWTDAALLEETLDRLAPDEVMEGFAETFALVMHGGYDKAAYDPTAQTLITQMENLVK